MICCINCFKDYEVRSIIRSLENRGDCQFCGSTGEFIYDTETDDSLIALFDELLSAYSPRSLLPADYPEELLGMLKDELCETWDIFAIDRRHVYQLVSSICKEQYAENRHLFDTPVGIPEMAQEEYIAINSLLKTGSWKDFVTSIKTDSRFHTRHINTDILSLFCTYATRTHKRGERFYRSRISNKGGLAISEMGAPPALKATAGRANPEGISYLYLSSNEETTLKEIRAGAHDYVTIGEFVLEQDINVVDLTAIDQVSAFSGLDFAQHVINKRHLRKISSEIARPLRRVDSPLDYLPTQYICDFIKSIQHDGKPEYQGIKYGSTMSRNGYNLAVFDQNSFKCVSASVVDIRELKYEYDRVSL